MRVPVCVASCSPATVKVSDVPPMTVKMMSAKGGKVIGHTGDCVLKSLRSMGLLQVRPSCVRRARVWRFLCACMSSG